jgi:hypothetical protein
MALEALFPDFMSLKILHLSDIGSKGDAAKKSDLMKNVESFKTKVLESYRQNQRKIDMPSNNEIVIELILTQVFWNTPNSNKRNTAIQRQAFELRPLLR